jgi:hypothetical protein
MPPLMYLLADAGYWIPLCKVVICASVPLEPEYAT